MTYALMTYVMSITNSSIKGTVGYIIVFNHSQGHIKEPVTFRMILLQGEGTCVSEKLYFEASYAFKQDLQLKKWSKKWQILTFRGDKYSN